MRKWRKTHRLKGVARQKANARSHAHVYLARGKLKRENCVDCGSSASQMHHADYSKPLKVTWICRPCHLAHHGIAERTNHPA